MGDPSPIWGSLPRNRATLPPIWNSSPIGGTASPTFGELPRNWGTLPTSAEPLQETGNSSPKWWLPSPISGQHSPQSSRCLRKASCRGKAAQPPPRFTPPRGRFLTFPGKERDSGTFHAFIPPRPEEREAEGEGIFFRSAGAGSDRKRVTPPLTRGFSGGGTVPPGCPLYPSSGGTPKNGSCHGRKRGVHAGERGDSDRKWGAPLQNWAAHAGEGDFWGKMGGNPRQKCGDSPRQEWGGFGGNVGATQSEMGRFKSGEGDSARAGATQSKMGQSTQERWFG